VIVPTNVQIVGISAAIIYIGCHGSLKAKLEAADPDVETTEELETMSAGDAAMFPVYGSCMLFSLYLAFKLLDKYWVNVLMGGYFSLVGALTLVPIIDQVVRPLFPNGGANQWKFDKKLALPELLGGEQHIVFTASELVSFGFAAVVGVFYFQTKHWALNNIFGISFSIQGVKSISLGSYKTGCTLLCGLFLYDIFWVFGTEVMVTVAKSFDAPIKLLFLTKFATDDAKASFSMLGLGDIVIPGIFVALMLRFDAEQCGLKKYTECFEKPYFHTTFLGYVLGLLTTVLVMFMFEAAQPALLYLVPSCIGASFLPSVLRGEMKELLAFTEETEEEGKKESEKAGSDKKKD
jgi:minor histocompatibility antigen H13